MFMKFFFTRWFARRRSVGSLQRMACLYLANGWLYHPVGTLADFLMHSVVCGE